MKVLGHEHLVDQVKLITATYFFEDLQEDIALARRAEQGTAPVATARDEMKMALAVAASRRFCKAKTLKHAPFANSAKDAAPANSNEKARPSQMNCLVI